MPSGLSAHSGDTSLLQLDLAVLPRLGPVLLVSAAQRPHCTVRDKEASENLDGFPTFHTGHMGRDGGEQLWGNTEIAADCSITPAEAWVFCGEEFSAVSARAWLCLPLVLWSRDDVASKHN